MKIKGPLIKGRFHSRPNRFLTVVEINGELVHSHLPDPGRLKELLLPGAELYLRPVSEEIPRKTRFTTVMVCHKGQFISLVSTLPNRFVKESLKKNKLPMFKNYKLLKPEITVGKHRFDFLLESPKGKLFYLEKYCVVVDIIFKISKIACIFQNNFEIVCRQSDVFHCHSYIWQ